MLRCFLTVLFVPVLALVFATCGDAGDSAGGDRNEQMPATPESPENPDVPETPETPDGSDGDGGDGGDDGNVDDGGGEPGGNDNEDFDMKIKITVGGAEFPATLDDSATGRAFASLLPVTMDMQELNGNEKYFYMQSSLPTAASRYDTISNGDLLLYGNNCVVLFYKSFSSGYSYTRIGRVDDVTGLAEAVGRGSVKVTFE